MGFLWGIYFFITYLLYYLLAFGYCYFVGEEGGGGCFL